MLPALMRARFALLIDVASAREKTPGSLARGFSSPVETGWRVSLRRSVLPPPNL